MSRKLAAMTTAVSPVLDTGAITEITTGGPDLSKPPSFAQVRNAIIAEATGKGVTCSPELAEQVIDRLGCYADLAPISKGGLAHISQGDMSNGVHDVMDAIMVDHPMGEPLNTAPVPATGSAHDMLNRHFFGGDSGQLKGLVHTKDLERGSVYCATGVVVHSVG